MDTRSSTEVGAGSVAHIDLAGTEASMTVRELLRELSLHPPDAVVITRYDESGFTDQITVSTLKARVLDPPLLGISHRAAGGVEAGVQVVSAVLIGPPETF